jgi:hypothetical protein
MTDFFKFQAGPKPFLWLGLALGVIAEFFLINWALYAAWMNAYPMADNTYWGYLFFIRVAIVLIVGLLCFWAVVRLGRIYGQERPYGK